MNPTGETGRESYDSVAQWEPRYRDWLTNLRLMRSDGLNAAVYTQVSDVEHECNGWLTYDRRVSKFAEETLADWHGRLYEPIRTRVLFDLAEGTIVQQRGEQPKGWADADFDAGDWPSLHASRGADLKPIGILDGRGPLHVRGVMTLSSVPERLAMRTVGVGQWELFINGDPIMAIGNSDRAGKVPYSTVLLPESAASHLRRGVNSVAFRIHGRDGDPPAPVGFALLAIEE